MDTTSGSGTGPHVAAGNDFNPLTILYIPLEEFLPILIKNKVLGVSASVQVVEDHLGCALHCR